MGFIPEKCSCPVNIGFDMTLGAALHEAMPPAPLINFSVEICAWQLWLPGKLLNQNSFSTSVYHKHKNEVGNVVLDGHDQGAILPHITLPVFFNILLPIVIIPFSSRQIAFTASTVKFNDKTVGCSCVWPVLPMMTCGEPCDMPLAFPIWNRLNTLKVGLNKLDLILGMAMIGASMVIGIVLDQVFKRFDIGGKIIDSIKDKMQRKLGLEIIEEGGEKLAKESMEEAQEAARDKLLYETLEQQFKQWKDRAAKEARESLADKILFENMEAVFGELKDQAARDAGDALTEKVVFGQFERFFREVSEEAGTSIGEHSARFLREAAEEKLNDSLARMLSHGSDKAVFSFFKEISEDNFENALSRFAQQKANELAAKTLKEISAEQFEQAVDNFVIGRVEAQTARQLQNQLQDEIFEECYEYARIRLIDELNPLDPQSLLEDGLKGLAGFGLTSQLTDNPTFKMDFGSPYAGAGFEYSAEEGTKFSPNLLYGKGELSQDGWSEYFAGEKL